MRPCIHPYRGKELESKPLIYNTSEFQILDMKFNSTAAVHQVPKLINDANAAANGCRDRSTRYAHLRKWSEPEDQAWVQNNVDAIGEPQRA